MIRFVSALVLTVIWWLISTTAHAHVTSRYIEEFWRTADGNDWSPAFLRAQQSVIARTALEIRLANRVYVCRSRIDVFRGLRVIGTGNGAANGGASGAATQLNFNNGTGGFLTHFVGTYAPEPTVSGYLEIRGVHILGSGGASTHGIQIQNAANLEWVHISGFGGNGFHADCTAPTTNCNRWHVANSRIVSNTGHGMFIDGADSNAGTAYNVSVESNGGRGVFDSSFLGNTYIMMHALVNIGLSYVTDNANARSVFIGCYSEGCAVHQIVTPSLIIGGFMCGNASATAGTLSSGTTGLSGGGSIQAANSIGANTITNRLGSPDTGQIAQELITSASAGSTLRLEYEPSASHTGFWVWRDTLTDSLAPFAYSHPGNVRGGRGQFHMQNGFYFGSNGTSDPHGYIKPRTIGTNNVTIENVGNIFAITAGTTATPIVLTTIAAHGYAVGHRVLITGVAGLSGANGLFTLSAITATTLTLSGSVGSGTYTTGTGLAHGAYASGRATAAPITGLWGLGDTVWNSSPAVGQPTYWVNTVAGSPGTWTAGPNL